MDKFTELTVVEETLLSFCKEKEWNFLSIEEDLRWKKSDVVHRQILLKSLQDLNKDIPSEKINEAVDELTKDRSSKSLYEANKEVHTLLKNGYWVEYENTDWSSETSTIRFIDWSTPTNNNFHVQQQPVIQWKIYTKRPDVVCYVNGLPFVVIECKNSNQPVRKAYDDNITDYLEAIPQLFVYNQFVILTNWSTTKLWAFTSSYEHFYTRQKIESEKETANKSMKTAVYWVLDNAKLLDIVENFVLFDNHYNAKIVAKNHQYLWVNNVYENFLDRWTLDGKLWVYRHTQWSGKSYSMMFVVQKILRQAKGNYTFVIVTDRKELDSQIAKWFTTCWVVNDADARADSIADLKKLLSQDRRVIFTLIHKFDETFAELNQRDDIIVMTDEAHRSQYGDLAMWMRKALPKANFLWFTWTPLIQEDVEATRDVFGKYVSVYNFSQSIQDGATVPIYYENYTPKVVNENPDLAKELEALQEKFTNKDDDDVVNNKISLAYAILTRDDVLDEIAKHIAHHYVSRWEWSNGKAMVVAIDKLTAVKMYWKVKNAFESIRWAGNAPEMAVMISLWDKQAEDRKMADSWWDFSILRNKIIEKDWDGTPLLEKKFKNTDDPLEIVFVCSMWLTWFDAKNCTTLYLQKPMKDHTLMQTIARTNRVYKWKTHGLIVDYVNVFSNLQKALSLYASPELWDPSDVIKNKETFVEDIEASLQLLTSYLDQKDIVLDTILWADWSTWIDLLDAIESIISSEESYKEFFRLSADFQKRYQALLPDPKCAPFRKSIGLVKFLVASVKEALGEWEWVSKEEIYQELQEILDRSIKVDEYKVVQNFRVKDLSKIDYSKLKEEFEEDHKNTIIQQLAKSMKETTEKMIAVNPTRKTLMEKLEKLMKAYNEWSKEIEEIFEELVKLSQEMTDEQHRSAREEMSEEQLAVFDLLRKEDLEESDEKAIKKIAKELLDIIKGVTESSVNRWEKDQTQAEVKVTIEKYLYDHLPSSYDLNLLQNKTDELYLYMYKNMRVS